MSEPVKRKQSPESYTPKDKPEILSMTENILKNNRDLLLPQEFIISPVRTIARFNGDSWPFSNVEPAVYSALGLLFGRTEAVDEAGALVNSDMEYSIHNVLTGHAFGLFYCLPDNLLSMSLYGFNSYRIPAQGLSLLEIREIIKKQINAGAVVHIDEGSRPHDYLFWGYKNDGNIFVGHKFEHGNDMLNCSYDFENPAEFDSLSEHIKDIVVYQPSGEQQSRERIYRTALEQGYRMLTRTTPPPEMDFERVHFGYGNAIYEEWTRQLEQSNAESSEAFYFSSPIFPHFIALYENRLHLYKFMRMYSDIRGETSVSKAAELCGRIKDLAQEGAQIGFENQWSDPKVLAMTNNQRRELLIDVLKKCRALELEIVECIKEFLEKPEDC